MQATASHFREEPCVDIFSFACLSILFRCCRYLRENQYRQAFKQSLVYKTQGADPILHSPNPSGCVIRVYSHNPNFPVHPIPHPLPIPPLSCIVPPLIVSARNIANTELLTIRFVAK